MGCEVVRMVEKWRYDELMRDYMEARAKIVALESQLAQLTAEREVMGKVEIGSDCDEWRNALWKYAWKPVMKFHGDMIREGSDKMKCLDTLRGELHGLIREIIDQCTGVKGFDSKGGIQVTDLVELRKLMRVMELHMNAEMFLSTHREVGHRVTVSVEVYDTKGTSKRGHAATFAEAVTQVKEMMEQTNATQQEAERT